MLTASNGTLDQRFADAMGEMLGPDFPTEIALAVSGGGDSMAMLSLAHNWTRVWGVTLKVVTIDHALRAESAAEAEMVARECATLGWSHDTLRWHWDGQGNLMDAARRARLDLIDGWRGTTRHVLMAHTRDDVAETFLLRLKRGSGVDGLSAMAKIRDVEGMQVVRPCLEMSRAELRHYARVLKTPWVDDPSNDNPSYDRVKMRQLLHGLEEVGLGIDTLSSTAERLGRAQVALRARAHHVWCELGSECESGDLLLDTDGFAKIERDTQLRVLAEGLGFVSGAEYRPRADALEALLDRVLSGGAGTLSGCEIRAERSKIRVYREYRAVEALTADAGDLWDGRWRLGHDTLSEVTVRALGQAGWQQVKDKPDTAPPYHAARSLPALWRGDCLVACEAMGVGPKACTKRVRLGFAERLLSH